MWSFLRRRRARGGPRGVEAGGATPKEQLRFLLNYGVLAPSGRAQPWSITARGGDIELTLAHTCRLAPSDVAHRDRVISCGAALAQVRLSLRQLGYGDAVDVLPEPDRPELLARIHLDEPRAATPEAYVLYQALRRPFVLGEDERARSFPPGLLSELVATAEAEGAELHFVDARPEAKESVPARSVEAVPGACSALPLGEVLQMLHPFQLRTFSPRTSEWSEEREIGLAGVAVAVIATGEDGIRDWLSAGQALSRVLLRARVDGVHAAVYGLHAKEARGALADARSRLPSSEAPQLVLRLGYPGGAKPTRRETPQPSNIVTPLPLVR